MKRLAIAALAATSLSGFAHAHDFDFTARPGPYAAQPRYEGRFGYAPPPPAATAPYGSGGGCFVTLSPTEATRGIRHWRPSC